MKIPRNAPCPCGSGRKFKKCHLGREEELFAAPEVPTQSIDVPETTAGVTEAVREADHFWHECVATYNDPERFRMNLNALIQAIRNVTFRIQAGKNSVVDFDTWYSPWQEFLRRQPLMRWLNDARIAVVKQAGLETHSTAQVTLISSYRETPPLSLKDCGGKHRCVWLRRKDYRGARGLPTLDVAAHPGAGAGSEANERVDDPRHAAKLLGSLVEGWWTRSNGGRPVR